MPPDEIVVNEAPAEIPAEVLAAVAEASAVEAEARVEVERVAGETAVAVAEVHAETDQAAIAASVEVATAVSREELDECRRNSETALTLARETQSTMQSILERLPPSLPSPNESPESAEGVPPVQEPVAESPPEPEKKKPAIRWT